MKKIFKIKGMHCNSCAQLIENELKEKVNKVSVSYAKKQAEIDFDENKVSENEIRSKIKELGYDVEGKDDRESIQESRKSMGMSDKIGWVVFIAGLILLFYMLYDFLRGISIDIPNLGEKTSLLLLFFVGILTGFHCISMCGAFVVSYTTKNALKGHKSFKQHLVYGSSKVFSYAIIGGIFGLIGGIFAFSIKLRGTIAILAGLFMVFYALSMFGIGFFKKFQFNPKFLTKIASKASGESEGAYKRPFVTGVLSGLFIACGPLQAMYLYAAGSGSFLNGLFSLGAFGLGTLPIMIGFGSLATVISHKTTRRILKISAIIVLVLGLVMLNRGLTVMGSPISYDSIKDTIIGTNSRDALMVNGFQEINMDVDRYGWKPNSFVLKKGVPVRWNINVKELTGCNNEIMVNNYGLDIKLKKGLNVVEFTPDKAGTVRWSCWMGMIPGSFIVTETGTATEKELASAEPGPVRSCDGNCGDPTCGAASGGGCGCGG